MKVTAIAPWFGGKRTLASDIVAELGPHAQYFEPFCGSMAVLLAKEPCRNETVNDLHGDLINLARVLQDRTSAEELYDRLQRVLVSEDLLEQARYELGSQEFPTIGVTGVLPDRAYWYFLASWMGRNGTAGTARVDYQIAVRWTNSGGASTTRWQNAVASIPAWHERLRNVVILRRDAFAILDRFEDSPETAVYCDPPYHAETRNFTKNGQGSKYKHEFRHDGDLLDGTDDHTRLRDTLARYRRARVVVSYYDSPRIRELYRGWTIVEHARHKHLHVQNARGASTWSRRFAEYPTFFRPAIMPEPKRSSLMPPRRKRAAASNKAAALHPDDQPVADLWLRYARRRKDVALRNAIIEHYYPRAAKIGMRLISRLPQNRRDDGHSRFAQVLILAVERFRPTCGVAFLCFLRRRLRGAVLDVFREGNPRKRKAFDRCRARVRAVKTLAATLGRPPNDDEVAAKLGCTVEQLWLDREGEETSLHATVWAKDGRAFALLDVLAAPAARDVPPEDPAEVERLFIAATADLPFRERLVLWLRCCRRKKPHNIARILGIPPKRVAALEKCAIARLRRAARPAPDTR